MLQIYFLTSEVPQQDFFIHYLVKEFQEVEKLSMKWMDRPSVTEMERGGVSEMEIANLLYPFL